MGAVGVESCNIHIGDRLAGFTRIIGASFESDESEDVLESLLIDREGCANRCFLNPACRSFDFKLPKCSDAGVVLGTCNLHVDTAGTVKITVSGVLIW